MTGTLVDDGGGGNPSSSLSSSLAGGQRPTAAGCLRPTGPGSDVFGLADGGSGGGGGIEECPGIGLGSCGGGGGGATALAGVGLDGGGGGSTEWPGALLTGVRLFMGPAAGRASP